VPELSKSQKAAQEEFKPFIAGCNRLAFKQPLNWLARGWSDYKRAPISSGIYGFVIVLISYIVTGVAYYFGSITVAIAMLSAFIFVAPTLCLGLYSVARQLKRYPEADFRKSFSHGCQAFGELSIFVIVMIVIALLWARAASMVHVFFPIGSESTEDLVTFLAIGSAVGSIFVTVVFSVSAFSLPMVMDKKVDMLTCCISSINAVLRNKKTMILWAGLIVTLTAIGFLTLFLGFLVIIPLLGYATWHSYRDTINADDWDDRIDEFTNNEVVTEDQPNA
jgi:uncharacterized membrane protein